MAAAALGFLRRLLTLFASGSGRRVAAAQRRSFYSGGGAAARVFLSSWAIGLNSGAFMGYEMEISGCCLTRLVWALARSGAPNSPAREGLRKLGPSFSLVWLGPTQAQYSLAENRS